MLRHVAFAWGNVSDRRTAAERGERAVGLAAVRTHHPKNGKWGGGRAAAHAPITPSPPSLKEQP